MIAFFGQDDDFGEDGWNGAAQQLKSYGKDPAQAIRTTFRRNTADVDGAVERLRKAGSTLKGVVMVGLEPRRRAPGGEGARVRAGCGLHGYLQRGRRPAPEELVGARVPLADNMVVTRWCRFRPRAPAR